MAIRSNVSIKSNIYVNKTGSASDKELLARVRGHAAISKIPYSLRTQSQQAEYMYGSPYCPKDKSRDKVRDYASENGQTLILIKCEQVECDNYAKCSKSAQFRKIERSKLDSGPGETQYVAPDFGLLRYLDADDKIVYLEVIKSKQEKYIKPDIITAPKISQPIETKPEPFETKLELEKGKEVKTGKEEKEITPDLPREVVPIKKAVTNKPSIIQYKKIDNPTELIQSGIEERIIVNAGPGTGKTYSVIKRLGYIVGNDLADPTKVLVLCYSRSAVGVIKRRINAEIDSGNMPFEAKLLFNSIRTFDSFVTYMLSEGELEGTINNLNYDERIEKFVAELQKDKTVFNGLEYLIVDEMQDLVGVRARLVKEILEQIDCGFLLLGDMCQSIYDYQIKDESELNSYRFYQWLNSKFNTGVKRLELTKNMRQKDEIAMFSEYMREAILSDDNEKQVQALSLCFDTLHKDNYVGHIRNLNSVNAVKSNGILCRNNAEVSIISTELFARDIVHHISKRAQHVDLVPWIAILLSTYTEPKIGISAFRERAYSAGYKDADAKWDLLKTVALDDNENVLDVKLLVKSLVSGIEIPYELDLARISAASVSTIHRAKGREYDDVLLVSDDYKRNYNTFDEIKVAYVAVSRGKERISFCDIPRYYIKQLNSRRWIATGRSRKSNKYFCSNFEIGTDEDINPYSFVNKNIDDATERQRYISTLKPGDLLEVWFMGGAYRIFHNGVYIGMLSDKIFYELRDAMEKTNRSYNLPNRLSNIYVNNIVTIANTKFNDVIAEPYTKSGLWLGVEISGFAKTDWS